jgi:tetratricopeptide (TPR) repeat protein
MGKPEGAIDAQRRAIGIDPSDANAHSNLGVLLRSTGKPFEAEAAYRTAIQLNPVHIDAYTDLGILLNGLKRTEAPRPAAKHVVWSLERDHSRNIMWTWPASRWSSPAGRTRPQDLLQRADT